MAGELRYSINGRVIKPHEEKKFAKDWQKDILMDHFNRNHYPAKDEFHELEKKIKLDKKWIRNWYQYQRKRRNIRQEQNSSKLSDQLFIEEEPQQGDSDVEDFPHNPEDEHLSSSKKANKNRVLSQPWQRVILLEYFARTAYPSKEMVAEIESKIHLDSVWIKSWFHTRRQRDKINPTSNLKTQKAGDKVTLSEDTETEESCEKPTEATDLNISEMYENLQKKFMDLHSRYNVLAELLLQRSIISEQNEASGNVDPKVPTVDLTESSEPSGPVRQYPGPAVSYPPPPPGYPYPHYFPPYYPPQYPQYSQPQFYPQPSPLGPGASHPSLSSLPYPPMPQ